VLSRGVMTTTSLVAASLVALLSGQSASDRQAYQSYQVQLARLLASGSGSVPPGGSTASVQAGCILVPGGGSTATTRDCAACHPSHEGRASHPVDVDQDAASFRSRGRSGPKLRLATEVVKRGVFLADGKVSCLTCHDGNSIWKHKIALPPDVPLREPVQPGDPRTYEPALARPSAMTGLTSTTGKQLLPPGTEVSPTPLCKVCHSFD
jgi:hypothetical protein